MFCTNAGNGFNPDSLPNCENVKMFETAIATTKNKITATIANFIKSSALALNFNFILLLPFAYIIH